MDVICTEKAPKAIGPYSQGMSFENFVFTSGQIPIHLETGKIEVFTIEEQTERACLNVKAVLEAAGLTLGDVIKTTCLLANIEDFQAFNAIYEKYFVGRPARSCFAVKALPAGAMIEIEAIAIKNR